MRKLILLARAAISWLLAGWTPLAVALAVAALAAGVALGRPLGDKVYAYQWSDARFCNDCHAHDYANEAWQSSVHADLTTCHDCHRVPIRHYPRNLWVTITNPPQSAADIPRPTIPVVICATCHLQGCDPHELSGPMSPELCADVVKITDSPLHRAHLEAERGAEEGPIGCVDCHGAGAGEVHRFEATTEACASCHESHAGELGLAGLGCRQCHGSAFLATGAVPQPGQATHDGGHGSQ